MRGRVGRLKSERRETGEGGKERVFVSPVQEEMGKSCSKSSPCSFRFRVTADFAL